VLNAPTQINDATRLLRHSEQMSSY